MSSDKDSRIPCSAETRDMVKAQKRGGESYEELLQKMIQQYNPERFRSASADGEGAEQ